LLAKILSILACSVFKIFPLKGKMACVSLSLPDFAEPQAESPSTIYNSDFTGSFEEQSANFPGRVIPSNAPFLITVSLAALAANLAFAARRTFSITCFAVFGSSSKNSVNFSEKTLSTAHLASGVHNFPFV
jgi:hypothetical protein